MNMESEQLLMLLPGNIYNALSRPYSGEMIKAPILMPKPRKLSHTPAWYS